MIHKALNLILRLKKQKQWKSLYINPIISVYLFRVPCKRTINSTCIIFSNKRPIVNLKNIITSKYFLQPVKERTGKLNDGTHSKTLLNFIEKWEVSYKNFILIVVTLKIMYSCTTEWILSSPRDVITLLGLLLISWAFVFLIKRSNLKCIFWFDHFWTVLTQWPYFIV